MASHVRKNRLRAPQQKSAHRQRHEAFLARQIEERNKQIDASRFQITDAVGDLDHDVDATVDALTLTAPDGSMIQICWDPYARGFTIRSIEAASGVMASGIEVMPRACNVVIVRARQSTEFIAAPIAEKLAEGARKRATKQ